MRTLPPLERHASCAVRSAPIASPEQSVKPSFAARQPACAANCAPGWAKCREPTTEMHGRCKSRKSPRQKSAAGHLAPSCSRSLCGNRASSLVITATSAFSAASKYPSSCRSRPRSETMCPASYSEYPSLRTSLTVTSRKGSSSPIPAARARLDSSRACARLSAPAHGVSQRTAEKEQAPFRLPHRRNLRRGWGFFSLGCSSTSVPSSKNFTGWIW